MKKRERQAGKQRWEGTTERWKHGGRKRRKKREREGGRDGGKGG